MRSFGTRGRVYPDKHYVVPRTEEIADFINRIKEGRYIVLFAPRQTGKTSFFRFSMETLTIEDPTYFPIQLNFEPYKNLTPSDFYKDLHKSICKEIEVVFQKRGRCPESLSQFLETTEITNHVSMMEFFEQCSSFLNNQHKIGQKVVLIIDEFDGIPQSVVSDFLHSLRNIYLSDELQCPHSVSIVGVKSITQLNYDRSISPFNIQDEFNLQNFSLQQVDELLSQYTDEVGQAFDPEVISTLHKQTAGQPFLVNRFAQILTEELDVPKTETVRMEHFLTAHEQMLDEQNTNIQHLLTNVRRDRRFEKLLMRITAYERGLPFTLDNEIINELVMYGVIKKGDDRMCEIVNPIYQHRIMQVFKPIVNGLEETYFPEDSDKDFIDYVSPAGEIELGALLDNFKDFIARAGFCILEVPETPQEYVGQNLLYAYLDYFVRIVHADMFLEVQTGRGRIDLLIIHNSRKYIVETKIWEGEKYYQAGKKQLVAYLKSEKADEGYYVVFDHRTNPEARVETETLDGVKIRSYVIPVVQEKPSSVSRS
ncbi:MAG: AAA-like domain-containing protein [Candidatus Poribacteria bacterium]|nr:AAA-like domain-containing protein [Candidatus Poribacteria bacterium]